MEPSEKKSRLRALHIVLILSFIANGLGAFSNLMMSLPGMRSTLSENMQLIPEVLHETYEMMLSIPATYYIATAIFSAVAFFGCLRMWRLKGIGFHYYTIAKLLLIATPLVFIGRQYLNLGDVMMSLLFIAYYFISLRALGAFNNHSNDMENPYASTTSTPSIPPENSDDSESSENSD
ncbi:MAG: hypothetical protein II975_04485 [Bacteroidales bacterium]|nr:hypothetical protein [Bacteroidales bacterium]